MAECIPPSIQATIASEGQITGSFTSEEVEDLVSVLIVGGLPLRLKDKPESVRTIIPTER